MAHADLLDERAGRKRGTRKSVAAVFMAASLGAAIAGCSGASANPTPPTVYVFLTATPKPSATPTATPAATATPAPTASPTPTPTPTPAPVACIASNLTISVQVSGGIAWQSGAGHRMATLILKNTGAVACNIKAKSQPLLLNGDGSVLVLGASPGASSTLKMVPGGKIHADVQTGNACGLPAIIDPVKVGFMFGGTGLVVVTPLSSTDEGALPSCMGDPSVYSGSIDVQPWAP
jgi:hypothetical protein